MVFKWLKVQWDRSAALALVVIGFVCLVVSYFGISRAVLPAQQIPYLASGGLFGLFALGIGATLWLSADLGDEWRKLDEISRKLDAGTLENPAGRPERAVSRVSNGSR